MNIHKSQFFKLCIITCSILLILIIIALFYIFNERQKWLEATYQIKELAKREETFNRTPNIHDCFFIVSRNYGLENYNEVIYYGNKCIDLGISKSSCGRLIHFWMAASFNKIGEIQPAENHLITALELDKDKLIIKNNWIEKTGMTNIYNNIDINIDSNHD
jgi:hypothetical protein